MRKGKNKRIWTPSRSHKHLDGHISARILEKEYGADIGGAATHGSKT